MLKRNLTIAAALFGIALLAGLPARSSASTGYVNAYTAYVDPTVGTTAAVSFTAYHSAYVNSGKFAIVVRGVLNVSANAGSMTFDSPTHVTMTGTILYNGQPAVYTFCASKPGSNGTYGSVGFTLSYAAGGLIYSTGAGGAPTEVHLFGFSGSWLYY